jgi:2-oxoglutarate ferredoxin oxidoreductase subunit alpha
VNADRIIQYEEEYVDDAEILLVAYGISARTSLRAMEIARERGIKVGMFRLITVWPFPTEKIASLAAQVKGIVVPELNLGQIALEVERAAAGRAPVRLVPHAGGGIHRPESVLAAIEEVAA